MANEYTNLRKLRSTDVCSQDVKLTGTTVERSGVPIRGIERHAYSTTQTLAMTDGLHFVVCQTTPAGWTLTLPAAAAGIILFVINLGPNTLTLALNGSDTVNGDAVPGGWDEQFAGTWLIGESGNWVAPHEIAFGS